MDVSAVVLAKLIEAQDIETWAKLKLGFIDPAYTTLYSAINRHYEKYSSIPSFDDLKISLRESTTINTLNSVELALNEEIDPEVAFDALIDQYTQSETIRLLDKFIDKLPIYDTVEIKENLSSIVLTLDEKTLTTEGVFSMSDIMLFKRPEELAKGRVHLGLNNTFDAVLGGCAKQELILIGGKRGSGKSITSSNILVNQYEAGNTAVYFTIEMVAHETLERNLSILADVNHQNIKKGTLTDQEVLGLVQCRADMFNDAQDLVQEFVNSKDRYKFEETLVRTKELKQDNQMIIIDDRALTLTSLDLHLGKLKARFGDKLTVAVVDYLNQIVIEGGSDQFDWKPQIVVSKKLKDLARKYDIVMVSPYQIDASGEARFSKGILDAADIALVMEAHDKETNAISFETTKIRGGREMKFSSSINWDTLRISPEPIQRPEEKEVIKKVTKSSKKYEPTGEKSSDMPQAWE